MTRRVFGFLLLAVACKETPTGGSPDAAQTSLAGTWQGVQSTEPNGDGDLARMVLEDAPGGQVRGALQVSYGMDAHDLGTIGRLAGPAQGGAFTRGPLLPDGGFGVQYMVTVTASQALNHLEMVEPHQVPDGGPFTVYYRFDRQ